MTRSFFLAAGAVAALAAGAQVSAARAEQRVTVSTQGLDLGTAPGAKAFYARLSHAVIAACGGAPTSFFTSEEERFQACYKTAMDQAVAGAHAPLVADLHAGKSIKSAAWTAR
jgi:UrcA family protein